MRIDIDKSGMLMIKRRGEYKMAICPYSKGEDYCGDWCPLFDLYEGDLNEGEYQQPMFHTELRLCHRTHQVTMRGQD